MTQKFIVVIPARYASQRLPGKPLQDIAGKPMIQRVYELGLKSGAADVIIATDDARILAVAREFSANCHMTSPDHQSGTDRLAEVARAAGWSDDQVVVNLQGDEPLMPPEVIGDCAALLADEQADIGTLASPFQRASDFENPNVVKVVADDAGFAMYFSRARIPYSRRPEVSKLAREAARQHHGLYAYRNAVLQTIVSAKQSSLEICEQLEQLRALSLGMKIKVGEPSVRPGPGVDTEDDLRHVEEVFRRQASSDCGD